MHKKESATGGKDIGNYSEDQKVKRMKKSEESLQELWDTVNNIHIMRILGGEGKEEGTESIFKAIMTENFQNLGRQMDIQIHEAQMAPNRLNPNSAYRETYYN